MANKKGHGKNKGRDMGGIKDLESLRNHCRVTDDGCWTYAGKLNPARKCRSPNLYVRPLGRTVSIGSAAHFIKYGRVTPKNYQYTAQCGNPLCANPDHRKLTKPGRHMTIKAMLGELDVGRIANLIPKPRKLSDADVVEIYTTKATMSAQEQAEKFGVSVRHVADIRAGKRRTDALRSVIGPAGMFSQLLMAA